MNHALSTALRENIMLTGAGRTDSGVHAKEYYAHFDLEIELNPEDCRQLQFSLNGILPKDIAVKDVFPVKPGLHARFSAISRTYEYLVCKQKDPFLVDRAWFNSHRLDMDVMNLGAAILMEYNDFQCFSKSNTQVKTYQCHIMQANWRTEGHLLVFTIKADRFVRNMVRAIVGTLTELGRGKISPEGFRKIIESGNRNLAGASAPAMGLYLAGIEYPDLRL